jgi:two-component system, LuxR family, response regulator FixJ
MVHEFPSRAIERRRVPAFARQVFVVDDDEDMRDLMQGMLAAEGFRVTGFADGEAFLAAASAELPVCVFLDLVLPRRSGIEILKELRARQLWAPVVMMSARKEAPLVVEAMKNGAFDYLTKPIDRHAPGQRVRAALDLWSCRAPGNGTAPVYADGNEWLRLSPSERDTLSLMRLMDLAQR